MSRNPLFASLCILSLLACTSKSEKQEHVKPETEIGRRAEPIRLDDARLYRKTEDFGTQGRDTFLLQGSAFTHINWNGVGQKWVTRSELLDTAANGIWIVRTLAIDFHGKTFDSIDSFKVRKTDQEAIIERWLSNRPTDPRRLPILK